MDATCARAHLESCVVNGAEPSGIATVGEINAVGGVAEDVDHRLVPFGDGLVQRSVSVGILRFYFNHPSNICTFTFTQVFL